MLTGIQTSENMERFTNDQSLAFTTLPLVAIKPYEHSPRTSRNPEYDRLISSISRNGLEQPLIVAQKPGAAHYVLHSGGNTRLEILIELHKNGDHRFENVPCIVKPWTGDLHTLVSHLRETEMHGALNFIDRARAIMRVYELAALETPGKLLTQRELSSFLHK